jgi:hypothetical protein
MFFPFLAAFLIALAMIKLGALTVMAGLLATALRIVVIVAVAAAGLYILRRISASK